MARRSAIRPVLGKALTISGNGGGATKTCFFFQAEDGIRDGTVTGVQTCALPIFSGNSRVVKVAQVVVKEALNPFTQFVWMARSEERRVGKECRSRGSQYH